MQVRDIRNVIINTLMLLPVVLTGCWHLSFLLSDQSDQKIVFIILAYAGAGGCLMAGSVVIFYLVQHVGRSPDNLKELFDDIIAGFVISCTAASAAGVVISEKQQDDYYGWIAALTFAASYSLAAMLILACSARERWYQPDFEKEFAALDQAITLSAETSEESSPENLED